MMGNELAINQNGMVGAGLIYSDRICHVAAFAIPSNPNDN